MRSALSVGLEQRSQLLQAHGRADLAATDLFEISSELPAVAVHQGLLKHGEQGIIRVEFLPPEAAYMPSTRNGVTCGTLINWPGTIRVSRVQLTESSKSDSE